MNKIALSSENLTKVYSKSNKLKQEVLALKNLSLEVKQGEIFGLLGPNGAGKTTFINILAGTVMKSSGKVTVWGYDLDKNPRQVRACIGIVPQEVNFDPFFSPKKLLELQAGFYGVKKEDRITDSILETVSLDRQANAYTRSLSGGMKRRLLIAKAMVHQPPILFLDEPTAGVDVELRKDMWLVVENLRQTGVTIILTTHYIEEAEAIADRVAVINQGEIIIVEDKKELIKKMGHKKLTIELQDEILKIPKELEKYKLLIDNNKTSLIYTYKAKGEKTGITDLLKDIKNEGLRLKDLITEQSSLEKIFVDLVKENNEN